MRRLMTLILKMSEIRTRSRTALLKESENQRRIDARITAALEKFIEDKGYRDELEVSEVAAGLGVSTQQLGYYFKHVLGKSFTQWRKEMRVEDAKALLRDTEMSISEIAGLVGIPDKSNFRKRFTDVAGCTPKEWRRMQLNGKEA